MSSEDLILVSRGGVREKLGSERNSLVSVKPSGGGIMISRINRSGRRDRAVCIAFELSFMAVT